MSNTLYERYETGKDNAWSMYGAIWRGQTFTVGNTGTNEDHKITSVKINVYRVGSPGNCYVNIRAVDGSSKPTGADLASGSANANGWSAVAYTMNEVVLSDPCTLTAGTKYAIVVHVDGTSTSNCLYAGTDNSSPTYSGGTFVYSVNSGSTWTSTTEDWLFDEYGLRFLTVTVDELLGLLDTSTPQKVVTKQDDELLGLLDTSVKNIGKSDTELLGLLDAKTKTVNKTDAELLGLLDGTTKTVNKTDTESLGLLDATSKQVRKTDAELLGLIDVTTKTTSKTIAELLGLFDSMSTLAIHARIFAELLGLLDSESAIKSGGGNAFTFTDTELLGLLDAYAHKTSKTFSESLGLLDTMTKNTNKTIAEQLGLFDTSVTSRKFSITETELLGLLDTTTKATSKTITELLGLLDSKTTVAKFSFNYTEIIGLLDTANLVKNYVSINFGYSFDINVYH